METFIAVLLAFLNVLAIDIFISPILGLILAVPIGIICGIAVTELFD